jgi:hypothetical protein
MARGQGAPTVLHVTGPVVLDWGNGVRIQLSPAGIVVAAGRQVPMPTKGTPGRKPSPATVKLRETMQADAAAGTQRSRADYLTILTEAGGPKSSNAAGIIVNREAKRAFGHPLGRAKTRKARGRKGGRQASPVTVLLREKLHADKTDGGLRDAPHYVRWVVDQPGVKMGLKQARPIVYRELRVARSG